MDMLFVRGDGVILVSQDTCVACAGIHFRSFRYHRHPERDYGTHDFARSSLYRIYILSGSSDRTCVSSLEDCISTVSLIYIVQ